ncbi:MAG: hypothetical protein JKY54_03685, partial [Flavobacteriales bacterium]|nr:hypothetical protein [Flavobacteriales bacterium]
MKKYELEGTFMPTRLRTVVFLCSVLLSMTALGQKSIKLEKQQTNFFYTQVNLHGGYVSDVNGQRWDITNRSPFNQIVFQYLGKSQRRLQKGYVKLISLNSYKLKSGIVYKQYVNAAGQKNAKLDFKIFDSWLKFDTKWDRTKVWIGNRSIPYGHDPKMDPASSFMTNITKMDLGFVQDLGLFVKTPINRKLDAEISVTTGGLLNRPFLVCDNLIDQNLPQQSGMSVQFDGYEYNRTFLALGRIGNQTFNKNELGIIGLAGAINSTFIPNDRITLLRLGGDWVYKYNELFKLSNRVFAGFSNSGLEGKFISLNAQSSVDIFLKGRFFLSSSFAINSATARNSSLYHLNRTFANSFTYSISTHTRLRLNAYNSYIKEVNEKQWGILLQFITGFGKRG